jgi:hypothetical protein
MRCRQGTSRCSATPTTTSRREEESAPIRTGCGYVPNYAHGTTWTARDYIKPSFPRTFQLFGYSATVARNVRVLAVGATGDPSNATGVNGDAGDTSSASSGAAFVFE